MGPRIILFLVSLACFGRTYTTSCSGTENPISEGGNWTSGSAAGWADIRKTPGICFGTQPGNSGAPQKFADSTAVVNGSWARPQTCQATVHIVGSAPSGAGVSAELECRVLTTIGASTITGYEILFSCVVANPYVQIVRWNGALADFTLLDAHSLASAVGEGDVIKATVDSSGNIKAFVNGTQVLCVGAGGCATAADTTFTTGDPGIGAYLNGTTGVNASYGFSSVTLSDGPTVSLSSSTIAFGNQAVGVPSSGSSVTVTNTGVSTLTISSLTIGGTNSGDFSTTGTNNCISASPIAVNGTCTITLAFTPGSSGARSGTDSIASNDSATPSVITLTGTGTSSVGSSTTLGASALLGSAVVH